MTAQKTNTPVVYVCGWLLSLNIIFIILLPAITCSSHSFSLLFNIPLCKYTTIYLPILLLIDIWAISRLRLSQTTLLWTLLYVFLLKIHKYFYCVYTSEWTIGYNMFNNSKHWQTVFQCGHTNLPPMSNVWDTAMRVSNIYQHIFSIILVGR